MTRGKPQADEASWFALRAGLVVGWADDVAPDGAWEFLRGYYKYDSPTGLKKGGGWILVPAGTEYIRPHPGVDSLAPARSALGGPLPGANSYNRFPSGYSLPEEEGNRRQVVRDSGGVDNRDGIERGGRHFHKLGVELSACVLIVVAHDVHHR